MRPRPIFTVMFLATCVVALSSEVVTAAPTDPAIFKVTNNSITYCLPSTHANYIVDGGTTSAPNKFGKFTGGVGNPQQPLCINAENKTTTKVYFTRYPANASNWREYSVERTGALGSPAAYQVCAQDIQSNLTCLYDSADDAGPAENLAHDGGVKIVVENIR